MVNLDSTKLMVGIEVINNFNKDLFRYSSDKNAHNELLTDKAILSNTPIHGLKSLVVDSFNQKLQIELSAKILGNNYPKGLNLNTIDQAIDTINKSGIIDINKNLFFDTASVLRCDVTDNIVPDINPEIVYKTLAALPIAKKYHVDHYSTKSNQGVSWKGNQKTIRDRMIFYDKTLEIQKDKFFKGNTTILKQLKGVVRVESNHSQFKQLTKQFGSRNLIELLGSDVKLNHDIFSRITAKSNDVDLRLFSQFEGMKFNAIRNYLGDKGIIDMCNNNWEQIQLFVRVYNPNNYKGRHGYMNKLKGLYNQLNTETKQIDLNLIEHIKELLAA